MVLLAATWVPAFAGIREVFPDLQRGLCAEDAAERVVSVVEDDPEEHSVGYSAYATRDGVVQLDASFMEGRERRMGGVACVRDFRHPVHLARLVMERTPHSLLCGEDAMRFAESQGCERRAMATDFTRAEYAEFLAGNRKRSGHDTVGCIALDDKGHFATAMSTSGLEYRLGGRISDSAMPACGYFCDDRIGAAVATGVGEDIMRGALAARAIDYLLSGESAESAARRVVSDLAERVEKLGPVAIVVARRDGDVGAAANHDRFTLSFAKSGTEPCKRKISACAPCTAP